MKCGGTLHCVLRPKGKGEASRGPQEESFLLKPKGMYLQAGLSLLLGTVCQDPTVE